MKPAHGARLQIRLGLSAAIRVLAFGCWSTSPHSVPSLATFSCSPSGPGLSAQWPRDSRMRPGRALAEQYAARGGGVDGSGELVSRVHVQC